MASRWGRSPEKKKEKRSSVQKATIFCKLCGDLQKKGLQFGKPPFSATFIYQIKNNTTLFLSFLKLKDLSEIYIGAN